MAFVIGTAGHVDHGKSSLVMALTGTDPDRLAEEQAREMTIDLGFAWLPLPDGSTASIIDVPGHRDFIDNMLAGVGGIDLALFVVAADEGVMPQTREHLAILDLLQIPAGVVAVTKIDMIDDPEWLKLLEGDLRSAFAGTLLENSPIVPVSARTGEGLPQLVEALHRATGTHAPRLDRGMPRLPVDRVFSMSGFGTVVTGTLMDGILSVGNDIEIMPEGRKGRIRGLQTHRETLQQAVPGSRVAINISGIEREDIHRGDVVTLPGLMQPTTLIDVQFRHLPDAGWPLKHDTRVKFYSGAAETQSVVRLLGETALSPGASGWLQLVLEKPLALARGDRYILRTPSPGATLGGGKILDAHPEHRWRRFKPEAIERFTRLASGTPEELVLDRLGTHIALLPDALQAATGLDREALEKAVAKLNQHGDVISLPDGWITATQQWQRITSRITEELAQYHETYPLKIGMPREALRSRLGLDLRLFGSVLDQLTRDERITEGGGTVKLESHRLRYTETQQGKIDSLLSSLAQMPYSPPDTKTAQAQVGNDVFQALLDQGTLVQVSPDIWFEAGTYQYMVEQIKKHLREHGAITVAAARDLFNTSRKYVLPLLEHLDAIKVTRRNGDERTLVEKNSDS
jgi:selenocysteine-specific elongation factor